MLVFQSHYGSVDVSEDITLLFRPAKALGRVKWGRVSPSLRKSISRLGDVKAKFSVQNEAREGEWTTVETTKWNAFSTRTPGSVSKEIT